MFVIYGDKKEVTVMIEKKFVVAYDGSPDSKKALAIAVEFAQPLSATILLVSVYELPVSHYSVESNYYYYDHEKVETALKEICAAKAEEAKKYCEEKNVPVYVNIMKGEPAPEIIKYAQQENARMIIAGTRGLGGFEGLLLGSVAHSLVTYSTIPVLIVK